MFYVTLSPSALSSVHAAEGHVQKLTADFRIALLSSKEKREAWEMKGACNANWMLIELGESLSRKG